MLKKYTCIPAILLLSLLMACSSIEIFKEHTEIAPYKEYRSFVLVNKEIQSTAFSSEQLDVEFQEKLIQEMEAMGYTYEAQNPDLILRYTSNQDPREREVYNNMNMFPMWGWRVWDPWMYDPMFYNRNRSSSRAYALLQVMVDFIDPKADKMLGHFTAVSEASSEKEERRKVLRSSSAILGAFREHLREHGR